MKLLLNKLEPYGAFQVYPWNCYQEPLSFAEVAKAINDKSLWSTPYLKTPGIDWDQDTWRRVHIERVAYFVICGWEDPIKVATKENGKAYDILDGNHRLAAAIFKGDDLVEADIL